MYVAWLDHPCFWDHFFQFLSWWSCWQNKTPGVFGRWCSASVRAGPPICAWWPNSPSDFWKNMGQREAFSSAMRQGFFKESFALNLSWNQNINHHPISGRICVDHDVQKLMQFMVNELMSQVHPTCHPQRRVSLTHGKVGKGENFDTWWSPNWVSKGAALRRGNDDILDFGFIILRHTVTLSVLVVTQGDPFGKEQPRRVLVVTLPRVPLWNPTCERSCRHLVVWKSYFLAHPSVMGKLLLFTYFGGTGRRFFAEVATPDSLDRLFFDSMQMQRMVVKVQRLRFSNDALCLWSESTASAYSIYSECDNNRTNNRVDALDIEIDLPASFHPQIMEVHRRKLQPQPGNWWPLGLVFWMKFHDFPMQFLRWHGRGVRAKVMPGVHVMSWLGSHAGSPGPRISRRAS